MKLSPKLNFELVNRLEEIRLRLGAPVRPAFSECETYLESLRNRTGAVSFFYVHDLRTGEVRFPHNIERVLGHIPRHYKEWLELIYPPFLARYIMLGWQTYELIYHDPKIEISFLSHQYHLEIPVYEADSDTYSWYLQQSEPLQFDAEGNMVLQVNYFTKTRELQSNWLLEKVAPMIFDKGGKRMLKWEDAINKEAANDFLNFCLLEVFTEKDWEVLDFLHEGLTSSKIAQVLGKKENAINRRRQNLLRRTREGLGLDVKNIHELTIYLRNHGIY